VRGGETAEETRKGLGDRDEERGEMEAWRIVRQEDAFVR
jgi:hypothetical protein